MTSRFHYCMDIVLGHEGGYADVKGDRGGKTMRGVTQATYDAFCDSHGQPRGNVKDITPFEVEAIYHTYWRDAHCDRLPENLDVCVYDCALNSGAKRAIKLLQRTLGIADDGIFGSQTLAALREEIRSGSIEQVCLDYLDERRDFYERIVAADDSQAKFLAGWLARIDKLEALV